MKKKIFIVILIFTCLFLGGCTKKKSIENLQIATGLSLDLDENGSLELSAQILNHHAVGDRPQEVSPVIVLSETGRTIQEAFRKLSTILPGKLFFSHFEILVIGEELAKAGIAPYIYFFSINEETIHQYNIIVARGCKGKDILKILSVVENIPAMSHYGKMISALDFYGIGKFYTVDKTINDINSPAIALSLGSLQIIGDIEKGNKLDNRKTIDLATYTKVSTLGIFRYDCLVGWLDEAESIGLNYLTNQIKSSFVVVTKADGNHASIEIYKSKLKKKLIVEGDKIKFKLSINFTGDITDDLTGITPHTNQYVADILERAKYEIRIMCEKAIQKTKEYKLDIFGFGRDIYRQNNSLWEKIKDNYHEEIFPNIEFEIIVDGELIRVKP